jgi:hypothetical protein
MVEHCGGSKTDGEFVHTLTLTDIASGWTECVSMRRRNQMLVIEAFDQVAADLPFPMLVSRIGVIGPFHDRRNRATR